MASPFDIAIGAASAVVPALIRPKRKIGDLVAMVTISEDHSDELTITQHPVDSEASITDHAYSNPATVVITCGWSESPSPEAFLGGTAFLSMQDLYNKLLLLQKSRTPFDVVTGKRSYKDMLIRALSTKTSVETEKALIVTIHCQQIIRVETVSVCVSADQSIQEAPEETTPVTPLGPVNVTEPPVSSVPDFNAAPYVLDPAAL